MLSNCSDDEQKGRTYVLIYFRRKSSPGSMALRYMGEHSLSPDLIRMIARQRQRVPYVASMVQQQNALMRQAIFELDT